MRYRDRRVEKHRKQMIHMFVEEYRHGRRVCMLIYRYK